MLYTENGDRMSNWWQRCEMHKPTVDGSDGKLPCFHGNGFRCSYKAQMQSLEPRNAQYVIFAKITQTWISLAKTGFSCQNRGFRIWSILSLFSKTNYTNRIYIGWSIHMHQEEGISVLPASSRGHAKVPKKSTGSGHEISLCNQARRIILCTCNVIHPIIT